MAPPNKKWDFSGYATKFNIKCADGRTILQDAFKHQDGAVVPLVYQHLSSEIGNVMGHAILEARELGMYAYCFLNSGKTASDAKITIEHGDINALSIFANQLRQNGGDVIHGMIRELSVVFAGSNPGAVIDNISISHADGSETVIESEVLIFSDSQIDLPCSDVSDPVLEHSDTETVVEPVLEHAAGSEKTLQEIFDTFNEEQRTVVFVMIAEAIDSAGQADPVTHSDNGEMEVMKTNVFDQSATGEATKTAAASTTLTHAQFGDILANAQRIGSLKEAFLLHTATYGIENIDYLFPDPQTLTNTPSMIQRDMAWVSSVLGGAQNRPFSRIKTVVADITADEARARGYVKASLKKEEVIKLLKRVTTPTTIYKKQKLDRDDIIDITDLDVVSWMKSEMRVMLDEERARAALISDGRAADSEDKVNEECIRPIYKDDDMFVHRVSIAHDAAVKDMVKSIIRSRKS